MLGDLTLFTRADETEGSWDIIAPIMQAWQDGRQEVAAYPAGEWGPEEAEKLLRRNGHEWRRP
jgi:glucose-6-phosphate 1-dehydrogenase